MARSQESTEIWSENLSESIQNAGQQGKTLLCFVTDDSETSANWNTIITKEKFRAALQASTVRLRLRQDTQEFGFLNGVCPIQSVPALVLINNGQIEAKFEADAVSKEDLEEKLEALYAPASVEEQTSAEPHRDSDEQCLEFAPSTGRMRLPNNAYDALREHTEKLRHQNISPNNILQLQLRMMDNIFAIKQHVKSIKDRPAGTKPTLSEDAISRLLNTPATMLQPRKSSATPAQSGQSAAGTSMQSTSSTSAQPLPNTSLSPPNNPVDSTRSQTQQRSPSQPQTPQSERIDYKRQQREREAAQRAERERIKAQIQSDREERRRLDSLRKQSEPATPRQQTSTTATPNRSEIRIQVRTFDGSTLRTTFPYTATITNDLRPWIDRTNQDANKIPYNLKLILTPLPNRNIEASEEEHTLPDLGIVGSATMIMVPVQGFVDSYAAPSGGVVGSVVGGAIGMGASVFSGVLGMLGWGGSSATTQQPAAPEARGTAATAEGSAESSQVKVRTLADQRAEERKKGNQLYNGNSLDFQGRKDEDDRKRD